MNHEEKITQVNAEGQNEPCEKESDDTYIVEGVVAGMLLGLLFGDALFGVGAGMGIGLVLGAVIGSCFKKKQKG